MDHPKDVGDRTTLAVMMALCDLGYAILVPFGENTRYDLVIEDREGFARVQCRPADYASGQFGGRPVALMPTTQTRAHPNATISVRSTISGSIARTTAASISSQSRTHKSGGKAHFE
jgi:hypothetical protein